MSSESLTGLEIKLRNENEELRLQLAEAQETLNAIQKGEVDAVFVTGADGAKVFSLTSAETPYRIIIEEMSEGAATILADGTVLYCNRRFSEFVSIQMEKIIGSNFTELIPEFDKIMFHKLIAESNLHNADTEIRHTATDGSNSYFKISFSPLSSALDGDFCVLVSEITQLKKKEAELQQAAVLLEQRVAERTADLSKEIDQRKQMELLIQNKNKELERLNEEKDKFFSVIAHDLRSPFNTFLGYTRIMSEELPKLGKEEVQAFALSMRRSATNLFQLLENLLEWSSLNRGFYPFKPVRFFLLPFVSEILNSLRETADKKGIIVHLRINGRAEVFADKNMFGVIIRNLTSNALKFTFPGGEIVISARSLPNNRVEISIKDNGIGMSQDLLKKLFQLGMKTSRQGTEGEPSTGLGLILCKDYVEKHQGSLWAESEEGHGSVFYFTVPHKDMNKPLC